MVTGREPQVRIGAAAEILPIVDFLPLAHICRRICFHGTSPKPPAKRITTIGGYSRLESPIESNIGRRTRDHRYEQVGFARSAGMDHMAAMVHAVLVPRVDRVAGLGIFLQ